MTDFASELLVEEELDKEEPMATQQQGHNKGDKDSGNKGAKELQRNHLLAAGNSALANQYSDHKTATMTTAAVSVTSPPPTKALTNDDTDLVPGKPAIAKINQKAKPKNSNPSLTNTENNSEAKPAIDATEPNALLDAQTLKRKALLHQTLAYLTQLKGPSPLPALFEATLLAGKDETVAFAKSIASTLLHLNHDLRNLAKKQFEVVLKQHQNHPLFIALKVQLGAWVNTNPPTLEPTPPIES